MFGYNIQYFKRCGKMSIKVIFEDIPKSFFDNKTRELHIRTNYTDNIELSQILEHEIEHIVEDSETLKNYENKWLGIAYEWLIKKKWIVVIIGFILSIYLQFYLDQTQCHTALANCESMLNPIFAPVTIR